MRNSSTAELEADNEADARKCEAILPGIKTLWGVLEDYVKEGMFHIFIFNMTEYGFDPSVPIVISLTVKDWEF